MSDNRVIIDKTGNVAIVRLARNEQLNALCYAFAVEITAVFRSLSSMDDVRAVILMSDARIFCAGLDLKETAEFFDGTASSMLNIGNSLAPFFECCSAIEECSKPVIAAVHGKCVGGGLDIISACDIRICTADAIFSLKEAALGLVADMGVLQRLPHIIGQGYTREMALTAGDYSASDAERMGLVNAVYPDKDALISAAEALARRISGNGPLGVRGTKEVLNYSRSATVQDGISLAVHKNMVLFTSDDFNEAVAAFKEKRLPHFKGN